MHVPARRAERARPLAELDDEQGRRSMSIEEITAIYDTIGEMTATVYFLARDEAGSDDPVGLIEDILRRVHEDTN